MTVSTTIRQHQEADAQFGGFFTALHKFIDRTINEFFSDTPGMAHPVVALERLRSSSMGEYRPQDGMLLHDTIKVDPYKATTGEKAAEVVAHELVHAWQHCVGRLPERNYHNSEFHNRLGLIGILSSGKRGQHVGFIEGGVWRWWLDENADLDLDKYNLLPEDAGDKRTLLKWQCEACGFSFRTRRDDISVVCQCFDNECGLPMVQVDE